MDVTLLLAATVALGAYLAGYWIGRLDERRAHRPALLERLAPYVAVSELDELRSTRRN